MADLARIDEECPPWRPAVDAESVETLQRVSMPVLGSFRQNGTLQLFWRALEFGAGDYSVWLYVPIFEDHLEKLRAARDSQELRETLDEIALDARVVALAEHHDTAPRVIAHAVFDDGVAFGPQIGSALAALHDHLQELNEADKRLADVVG